MYKHFARTNWKVIQLNRVKETRAVAWYSWNFVVYVERTIEKKQFRFRQASVMNMHN